MSAQWDPETQKLFNRVREIQQATVHNTGRPIHIANVIPRPTKRSGLRLNAEDHRDSLHVRFSGGKVLITGYQLSDAFVDLQFHLTPTQWQIVVGAVQEMMEAECAKN